MLIIEKNKYNMWLSYIEKEYLCKIDRLLDDDKFRYFLMKTIPQKDLIDHIALNEWSNLLSDLLILERDLDLIYLVMDEKISSLFKEKLYFDIAIPSYEYNIDYIKHINIQDNIWKSFLLRVLNIYDLEKIIDKTWIPILSYFIYKKGDVRLDSILSDSMRKECYYFTNI